MKFLSEYVRDSALLVGHVGIIRSALQLERDTFGIVLSTSNLER